MRRGGAEARGLSQAGGNVAKRAITATAAAAAPATRRTCCRGNEMAGSGVGAFSPNVDDIERRQRGCDGAAVLSQFKSDVKLP